MVEYLTYAEYTEMGGTLEEALFNLFAYDAQTYIDWITFNRLWKEEWRTEDIMERVKKCMYRLIELVQAKNNLITPDVASTGGINVAAQVSEQSNDGVSVRYSVLSADALYDKAKAEINDCIQRYLNGVADNLGRKILYRGLYPGE